MCSEASRKHILPVPPKTSFQTNDVYLLALAESQNAEITTPDSRIDPNQLRDETHHYHLRAYQSARIPENLQLPIVPLKGHSTPMLELSYHFETKLTKIATVFGTGTLNPVRFKRRNALADITQTLCSKLLDCLHTRVFAV